MALISVMSAKGAPGTTTTSALLAALWPRTSVLLDADPMGGDLALQATTDDGAALRSQTGLLSLLPLARRGLAADVVMNHVQTMNGGQQVIAGLGGPEQARAVGALWDEIGRAMSTLPGADVLADVGQVHADSVHLALVRRSAAVVCVVRPRVASVVHTRERLAQVRQALTAPDGSCPRIGFVVVHDIQEQRDSASVADVLTQAHDWVVELGSIAHDPEAARMFAGVPVRRPERTMLVRSGREVVQRLTAMIPAPAPAAVLDTPAAIVATPAPVVEAPEPPAALETDARAESPAVRPVADLPPEDATALVPVGRSTTSDALPPATSKPVAQLPTVVRAPGTATPSSAPASDAAPTMSDDAPTRAARAVPPEAEKRASMRAERRLRRL